MKSLNYLIEKKFLLFLCVSFLLYGNTLENGYGIDDQFVTENNYTNQGLKSIKRIFTSYYAENDGKNNYEYRPIVKVSFALEHQLFGVRPWVGHLINIILYALCLFLLYKVLTIIFHSQTPFFNLCIVLIFAFLPIHSEVVASLKNRDVLLCFIFCMAIIINLDTFLKSNNYLYLFLAIIFTITGFLTKYDLLPFLAITPLVLYKKHKFKIMPFILISGVFFIGLYFSKYLKHALLDKSLSERIYKYYENPLFFEHSIDLKISAAFNSIGFYIKMLFFPSKMVCYYGYNTLDIFNLFSVFSIIGIVFFILMAFYFFKLFKTENPIWYAIVFSGIPISMYLNVVKTVPGIVADRFLFFSSIGFSMFLTYLLFRYINKNLNGDTFQKTNANFKTLFLLILIIYSTLTISRNFEWKNRLTLFEHDVKKRPESAALNLLYSNEVLLYLKQPNSTLTEQKKTRYISNAIASLNNVLKIDSLNPTALNNLAFINQNVYNDYKGAAKYYKKALQTDTTKFEVQFNLSYCLYRIGDYSEAEKLILKLYSKNPTNQQVLDLMSYILIENKKSKQGLKLFHDLEKKHPDNNSIYIILANFYIADFDTLNAKHYYSLALKNDPKNHQLIGIVDRLSK